jgi:hypothetical protein
VRGFLGRVAARAVGEATVARPRLADPFGLHEAEVPVGLEVARRGVVVSPPDRVDGPRPLGVARATSRSGQQVTAPAAERPTRREGLAESVERLGVSPTRKAEPVTSTRMPSPDAEPEELAPAPSPSSPPTASPATALPVAPLARATPVVPAPVSPGAAAVRVAAEEPAVRVHIGRLEVRANLEQPAPQARRRGESRRTPELSLSDYLRGRQAR